MNCLRNRNFSTTIKFFFEPKPLNLWVSLNVKRSYSGCIRIRRKWCEAQLRLWVKYTFKTYFFRRFTTCINCSNFSCSLLRVSKLTCTSSTCTVWRDITTNAAPDLAVAQKLEIFPVVAVKFGSHTGRGRIYFFLQKIKSWPFSLFLQLRLVSIYVVNVHFIGFLILVLN